MAACFLALAHRRFKAARMFAIPSALILRFAGLGGLGAFSAAMLSPRNAAYRRRWDKAIFRRVAALKLRLGLIPS